MQLIINDGNPSKMTSSQSTPMWITAQTKRFIPKYFTMENILNKIVLIGH